ncbi:helix-turn-helix domain-containing protein [Aquihabitans sp. G128]|uniref:helix-turn-helix transcriptional regulator n=1 Tax=Aquihabitans sp. G128 TaxID=2849779 RepID=UPI001C2503E4|nr:helix-turn-helix domain-containing protein [Aquihabitans sp. G128]QXC60958.1 helix-turn-helix domain-containing protein [Aquihabitans sp. G128]
MVQPSLSPTEFSSAVTAITAAFGDPTRREIYLFAHGRPEGVTASEVAERFELHSNVARHHLDKLASGGHLEVTVGRVPGSPGAGRPSKRYRTHGEAVELDLPVRHDDVLISLLGKALAMLPPAQAEAMAEDVGMEYGRKMAEAMGEVGDVQRSFRTALHAVADALSAHGFAAHAEQHDGGLRIISDHCPFGDAAVEHPVICAVDRGMVRGMLETLYGDTAPITEASRAAGDRACITSISG